MKNNKKISGFTLIELLMVIAIIGILAGILIPTVGAVRTQANLAASKAQLSNYVTAITMFKGEYGYYPFPNAQTNNGANVNSLSDDFIETLSGRNDSGNTISTGGIVAESLFIVFLSLSFCLKMTILLIIAPSQIASTTPKSSLPLTVMATAMFRSQEIVN